MRRTLLIAGMWLPLVGQTFEVAAVRPVGDAECGRGSLVFRVDAVRMDIRCMTISELIEDAYRVPWSRVDWPGWLRGTAPRFDVAAKLPEGTTKDQIPAMLQALLKERFGLAIHRVVQKLPSYGLTVIKDGSKAPVVAEEAPSGVNDDPAARAGNVRLNGIEFRLTIPADTNARADMMNNPQMGLVRESWNAQGTKARIDAPSITMDGLAEWLTLRLGWSAPISDLTGIAGRFQVVLDFSTSDAAHPFGGLNLDLSSHISNMRFEYPGREREEIFAAFNAALKKIGLELKDHDSTVEMIVIDHLERTPSDN